MVFAPIRGVENGVPKTIAAGKNVKNAENARVSRARPEVGLRGVFEGCACAEPTF
jgi:hypothetical protein